MFIVLLHIMVNALKHTKCVSLSNEICEIKPTLINLHPNKYSQEFHYYPFLVELNRCFGSCNNIKLSNKICIPKKTEGLNLSILNKIKGINDITLIKHLYVNVSVDLIEKM